MSAGGVVDAELVEDGEPETSASTELVPQAGVSVTTPVQATDLVARLATIREAMDTAMEEGVDYGKIPGTDKPTLFKPGSEKLAVLFQLDVQTIHEERWDGDHLTVSARATVFHAPTRMRLGNGEGLCSTRERKYAYRNAQRTCPECGARAIIKGKEEYGGGWVCFKKKGGCGAKFLDEAPEIVGQTVGEVDNPDLPDSWNTVIKMARKRAITDAVLLTTSASALFTQDLDDQVEGEPATESSPPFGPEADAALGDQACRVLGYLLSLPPDDDAVQAILLKIKQEAGGYYPKAALRALVWAGASVKAQAEEATAPQPRGHAEAGEVDAPALSGESFEGDMAILRGVGCTCENPLTPGAFKFDDDCPVRGHAIPF